MCVHMYVSAYDDKEFVILLKLLLINRRIGSVVERNVREIIFDS